jgi:PEP-CTERM motif
MFLKRLLLLLWLAGPADPAQATSFVLNVTTDPSTGTIQNDVDVSNNVGQVWKSSEIAINQIVVNQGDDVTVNVTFSGGQSIQLQSGAWFSGNEELGFTLLPLDPGTTISESSTLASLTGVVGALDATLPIDVNGTAIGEIAGDVAADLTGTSFQFDGFSLHTTFTSLTGGPVTLSSIQLLAAANNVAVVPEPSVAVLLGAGFIGLARLRKRS